MYRKFIVFHRHIITEVNVWRIKRGVWKRQVCYNYFYQFHQITAAINAAISKEGYSNAETNISAKKAPR
jgi:hypothetical protein